MPAFADFRIGRTDGVWLLIRMVLLSLPSFISLAGFSLFYFRPSPHGQLAYSRLLLVQIVVVATVAQMFTTPLAAVTLFKMLRLRPSGNRVAAVAFFCVCLVGFCAVCAGVVAAFLIF